MFKRFLHFVLMAGLLLCVTTAGYAGTVTVTQASQSFSTSTWPLTPSFTFTTFDTTLGDLTAIRFIIDITSVSAEATYSNNSADPMDITDITHSWEFALQSAVGEYPVDGAFVYNFAAPVTPVDDILGLGAGEKKVVSGLTADLTEGQGTYTSVFDASGNYVSGSGSETDPINAAAFQGAGSGTVTLYMDGRMWDTATYPADGGADSTGSAAGTVSIEYDYTTGGEVPEPITLGLMGSGLIFVAFLGRRRMSR